MLRFIFGLPAAGKTYTVINMIKELALKEKQVIYLVPEQFSFESERAVLKALGDKAALNVSVMSFSRLCDEVGRNVGGIAGRALKDSDKVIFMSRVLNDVRDELLLWGRYCSSVFFAETLLDTVGEFKINAVTPEELKKASEHTENETLKAKLHDISLIFEAYDTLLGEQFIDPADNLTKLYRQLEGFKFFKGKTVFIDSFKGFTGQQFKIIDRILADADDTVISLTNDPENTTDYNVYTNIRKAAERIKKSAARFKIAEDKPIILNQSRYNSEKIATIERLLAGVDAVSDSVNDDITVCAADVAADEAEFVARTIRKLVRKKGYRYRDFVIIARETENYEESIFTACRQNDVPLFGDRREPLSAFPLSAAISAAIENTIKTSTESILRFHKTGLGTLSLEEISKLENYALLWNIDGKLWNEEWQMNPKGFVINEGEVDLEELKHINTLRLKATAVLNEFKESFSGTAQNMARAIVELAEKCGTANKLAALSDRFKNEGAQFSSDVLKQSYDSYMKLLDSLAFCFGSRTLKRKEFAEALDLSVSLDSVGVIPRMLDEVTFGAADRIRPSRPKVAFILGANAGVFPKGLNTTGLLGINERKSLIELGIDIPDNQLSSVIDENFLVYSNLTCPSDRLYISYAENGLSGEKLESSAFVGEICEKLCVKKVKEPIYNLAEDNLPETLQSAYSQYCRLRLSGDGAAELKEALSGTDYQNKIEYTEEKLRGNIARLNPDTAKRLFGKSIRMSASKLDTFHKCRFYFFCKYGIGAKKLQPAEFDVLQRGTIVHYVLEKIVGKYKKGLSLLSREETDKLTEQYVNEYLDSIVGYRAVETERSKFLVSRITRALKEVVNRLALEFAQSDFEPVSCELKIGDGGDIPELKIPFDGGDISIIGSIDRVDKFGGYIRVIDYKTGTKSFKLPDVFFGLNLQMLIYLYALVRKDGDDEKAAGILYMPSKRDLDDNGLAMNGLIRPEVEIHSAMDKAMAGEFVPRPTQKSAFAAAEDFTEIFDYIETLIKKTGKHILSGSIEINPLDGRETPACKYCDYASVCGREGAPCERVPSLSGSEVIEKMREVKENGI